MKAVEGCPNERMMITTIISENTLGRLHASDTAAEKTFIILSNPLVVPLKKVLSAHLLL